MDPRAPQNNAGPDQGIVALVNEFLDRRQAGENLTLQRFVAEHPEVAEQLRLSLGGLPLIDTARRLALDAGEATPAGTELPAVAGYDLIEKIGRGGMGVVYKALQVSTKRIVALKVMLGGAFAAPSARRRFDREVELAARLQHAAIVRVLASGEAAGQRYYAMDYVAGVRLNRYLSTSQLDPATTLSLFVEICEAVEYAHGHGVVHRDLKPANVLIDDEGHPHVLDFGLAKAIDQADTEDAVTTCVSLPGQVVGTLFYLSPEQAAGTPDQVDARSDVYALGVMLFEALTGSLPFDTTGRPSQVVRRILESPPTRPRSRSSRIDGELETIILKALEKEKQRRYQSAHEMAADIRRYLAGEPLRARRPSSLYVLRKKLRRHRVAVAVGAAAVALSSIGLLAGVWWREHELAQARRDALGIQGALESQVPTDALGPARGLFERHPELPEAGLVLAQALYRSQRQARAVGVLEGVLERDPARRACRALLAEFYRAAGDAERADTLQTQAPPEDASDTAEAWYLRSFATLEPRRALECAQQAVQRQPSHVLAWERLTWLRLHTGDLDGALAGADKLIALGEGTREWTIWKGQVLVRQRRFREAIEEYTRVGSSACVYLAHTYRRVKEYEKAVEYYTKALGPAPPSAAARWHFYQRATPLWILGRRAEALEDYRRFRRLHGGPFYSDARAFLILRELGRQRDAQELLDAARREVQDHWLRLIFLCLAAQLSPDDLVADGLARNNPEQLCEAYYYAGEVCLLSNRPAAARKWFERCVQTGVEFDPDTSPETPMNEYELAQWRLESLPARAP